MIGELVAEARTLLAAGMSPVDALVRLFEAHDLDDVHEVAVAAGVPQADAEARLRRIGEFEKEGFVDEEGVRQPEDTRLAAETVETGVSCSTSTSSTTTRAAGSRS